MQFKLQDYKEGEIYDISHDYSAKELDVEFVDLKYTKPLHMEGTVEKGHDILTFQGELQSAIEIMCGRCLVNAAQSFTKDFQFYFEIAGKEIIDATDDVRELLILEHPLSYLCSEKCKGLCPRCGINLNESSCKCERQEGGSLAQLKDIWNKRKGESN